MLHSQKPSSECEAVLVSYSVWDARLLYLFPFSSSCFVLSFELGGGKETPQFSDTQIPKDSQTTDCIAGRKKRKKKRKKTPFETETNGSSTEPLEWLRDGGRKQHLSCRFSLKNKCWVEERKQKVLCYDEDHRRLWPAEILPRALLGGEWGGGGCWLSICMLIPRLGSRNEGFATTQTQGRDSRMGAVSQRLMVKVNDHDVHFACQTRRRWEIKTTRFQNFSLMCVNPGDFGECWISHLNMLKYSFFFKKKNKKMLLHVTVVNQEMSVTLIQRVLSCADFSIKKKKKTEQADWGLCGLNKNKLDFF